MKDVGWRQKAVEKIRHFADLEVNWDGEGGAPPTQRVIENAIAFVVDGDQDTDNVPDIAPFGEGIQISWALRDGGEIGWQFTDNPDETGWYTL